MQQRGISATNDVLLKILDGMNECDKQKGPSGGHEPLKVACQGQKLYIHCQPPQLSPQLQEEMYLLILMVYHHILFGFGAVRFCEWSQAAWELQRAFLLGEDGANKWDMHFMSVYHDNDGHWLDSNKDLIAGRAMSQWWDKSDESGPAARASEPFGVELPTLECLAVSGAELKPLGQPTTYMFFKFCCFIHINSFSISID